MSYLMLLLLGIGVVPPTLGISSSLLK